MISKVLLLCSIFAAVSCFSFFNLAEDEWNLFKLQYGKKYTGPEEELRKAIFFENKLKVAAHNKLHALGQKTYTLKMNKFGDMLQSEFARTMIGLKGFNETELKAQRSIEAASFIEPDDDVVLPKSVDWRKKGGVTSVKEQGDCWSCYAFSAVASLEGVHFRKTGKLVTLSAQQIIDCSRLFGNLGCTGGLMDYAFKYIKFSDGIATDKSYPYTGIEGHCHYWPDHYNPKEIGATVKGYVDIEKGNEEAMKKAVATVGPISVAIDASTASFQLYHSGIYYGTEHCKASNLNQGLTIVGYGTSEKGEDYWLVKNSWGKSWGNEGYVKIARNRNTCGIAMIPSYPLV